MDIEKIYNGPDFMWDEDIPWTDQVHEMSDFHVAVFRDGYPVTPGHLLFVPKFNSVAILNEAVAHAIKTGQTAVDNQEYSAYNIGINMGKAAGQTVRWPHVHLIPRQEGDTEDPVGGVRNVIPGKGNYKKGKE